MTARKAAGAADATGRAAPVRVLHLHSTFDAGGKERRAVALMNRFGPGIDLAAR